MELILWRHADAGDPENDPEADFERRLWYVLFWRPWGKQEIDAVADADRIVLPE